MSSSEMGKALAEMDPTRSGTISFADFEGWWKENGWKRFTIAGTIAAME